MNKHCILILCACFISLWLVFSLLQNEKIYENTLGRISATWVNKDGIPRLEQEPFRKLTSENYIQWDAVHYHLIKKYGYDINQYGYDINEAEADYIYAFFPLFPFIWKATALPPIGVVFLNYFFFAAGLLLLNNIFPKQKNSPKNPLFLTAFILPGIVVFLIPYSEATFFLAGAIGIYGLARKKYWLYFLGFFLCALTRPSFTFLALSILATELFFFFYHQNGIKVLKNISFRLVPLLVGTLIVSLIQFSAPGGGFFKYMKVQKYWNHVFSLPRQITDWSHEGFGMSVGVIFLIALPLLLVLTGLTFRQIFAAARKLPRLAVESTPRNYLQILSVFYIIGIFLFIIFFQGGSFNGLSRYVLCTPFFFILLFYAFPHFKTAGKIYRLLIFAVLTGIATVFLNTIEYSMNWNFSDTGFFLLAAMLFFWLFQDFSHSRIFRIAVLCVVMVNIVWTTYLFNMYIANGWIFT